jgi:hypothetical protein
MKLIAILAAAVMTFTAAVSQDIRVERPTSLNVTGVAVRNFDSDTYRGGLAFPVLSFVDYDRPDKRAVASINTWLLTDLKAGEGLYLGLGLHVPVFQNHNFSLAGTVGWSADFTDFKDVRSGAWGAGLSLNVRF